MQAQAGAYIILSLPSLQIKQLSAFPEHVKQLYEQGKQFPVLSS